MDDGNTLTSEPFSSRKMSRGRADDVPLDDRLGIPDKENITGLCDLVGSLIRPPLCHDDEKAMIVLRRPGSAKISQADGYIFRLVRQAAVDRETAPWAFYLVGPDGIQEVTEDEGQ